MTTPKQSLFEKMEANRKKLQELEKEKLCLLEQLRHQKEQEKEVFVDRLSDVLNESVLLVDLLAPEHSKWSCSDSDLDNGTWSGNERTGYCVRCLVLDVQRHRQLPEGYTLKLVVERE